MARRRRPSERRHRALSTSSPTAAAVLTDLRAAVGVPDAVSTAEEELADAAADRSGHRSSTLPLAVVHASSIGDVQAVLRFASAHGVAVVPRGAGTGLAGGAIGSRGEIVLSLARMDRLLEVSVDDELAVVEPGIVNAHLNELLRPHGLWFAPDPASRSISTVGGNIATNAGGLLCVKYGVTREAVLGLRVVTASGELISTGHRTVKGVTGLDLTSLLIGSEGTLGVIVEATLKLRPIPEGPVVTLGAAFDGVEAAARAASVLIASHLKPAIMELLDAASIQAIAAHLGSAELGHPGAYLLVRFDGPGADADADAALRVVRSLGGRPTLTDDPDEGERLFEIRRAFHPAMEKLGTVLIEDVSVPRSRLAAMFQAVAEIGERYGIVIPTVAHAGDGNLHPNLVFDGPEVPERVWDAAGELFSACLRLGGTLTGEHGVGLLKRRWLGDELGTTQLELQRGIKRVFDPDNLLNPGKVF